MKLTLRELVERRPVTSAGEVPSASFSVIVPKMRVEAALAPVGKIQGADSNLEPIPIWSSATYR
jgi:hypothetical protein